MGEEAKNAATSRWSAFLVEVSVSVSQVLVFFFIALFSTNFLRDKKAVLSFVEQKINGTTFPEFGFAVLSILVVSGLFYFLVTAVKGSEVLNHVARQVLLEMPRTISIFGSSIYAVFLAIAVHLHNFPEEGAEFSNLKFLLIGTLFWGMAFTYSFMIKRALGSPSFPASLADNP